MTTSESINEIATALAKAQGEMGGASKSAANPFFKSKYADLASVREAVNGPLTKHGICVVQSPHTTGNVVSVETMLVHSSGQWMRGDVSCTAKDDSPQAVGSAITYLRRYALQSFAGVAPEDDDAEAAQGRGKPTTQAQVQTAPPPRGFENWLIDLESTVPEGMSALEKAWYASKKEYRDVLIGKAKWEQMKAAAQKVTLAKKPQPQVLTSEIA